MSICTNNITQIIHFNYYKTTCLSKIKAEHPRIYLSMASFPLILVGLGVLKQSDLTFLLSKYNQ